MTIESMIEAGTAALPTFKSADDGSLEQPGLINGEGTGRSEGDHRALTGTGDPTDQPLVPWLVEQAAKGDRDAWNALVDRFGPTVWAIARGHRLNQSDAADVFQTTWLRLLEHLDRIQQPERVGAWLATTARRECLRLLRLAGRQLANGDDFDVLPDPRTSRAPDGNLLAAERREIVNQLVEQLPLRSQLLLRMLSADSPLSYLEISEALSMPVGSIGPTRARALEQLRRAAVRAGIDLEEVFFT
jgi:RNA polymerase sigma factor (sigma-70 family)